MAIEIERKFLVADLGYKEMAVSSTEILQGYLSRDPERTVRVRVRGNQGFLTVKGITRGSSRLEFEYEIPEEDAREMLELCIPPIIKKIRHMVPYRGYVWEVDEFSGDLYPLVLAEVELPSEDAEIEIPPFIGKEVTANPQYYNSTLGA